MNYKNSEISAAIDEFVHSERDRRLLKRRFVDGVKFEPLAEEFDLSVRHTQKIVRDHTSKIFKNIM